ncbi:MAG: ATP-binding protein [bacterium]|nr:ATP-binding protein [bacterium]
MNSYVVIAVSSLIVIVIVVAFLLRGHKKSGSSQARIGSAHVLADSLSNEKMKSDIILTAITDGVVLIDNNEAIQLFNPAAGNITGWKPEEALGIDYKSVLQLYNEKNDPYSQDQNPFARASSIKTMVHDKRASLHTRSNKTISLDISVSPLLTDSGELRGLVGIFRDVSEERQEEAQRADFISTASHEMRTPVAAIEGYLALALNDRVAKIDDKARLFIQKAHESTERLGKLFQDLLTSSKAEDGRLVNHQTVVEMGEFLSTLTDDFRFTAQAHSLNTEFILGAPDSVVSGSNSSVIKPLYYTFVDPDRMREVITNLFDNSIKYTEHGKITIGLTGDENVVQIRVSDTGEGIPAEDVPHLFQKFYRVDSSITRPIGGTGLGLFISRKIVELYHGRIWVESELGKGSTFYINLPRLSNDKINQIKQESEDKAQTIQPNQNPPANVLKS